MHRGEDARVQQEALPSFHTLFTVTFNPPPAYTLLFTHRTHGAHVHNWHTDFNLCKYM